LPKGNEKGGFACIPADTNSRRNRRLHLHAVLANPESAVSDSRCFSSLRLPLGLENRIALSSAFSTRFRREEPTLLCARSTASIA
jgi:hypothetical protein